MRDLESREDIELIIEKFYEELLSDKLLGDLFKSEIGERLEAHLAVINSFWVFNVLGEGHYRNNMFAAHLEIHDRWNLDQNKFDRWLELFHQTIDQNHKGENAEKMKVNASGIAAVMISKFQGGSFFTGKL